MKKRKIGNALIRSNKAVKFSHSFEKIQEVEDLFVCELGIEITSQDVKTKLKEFIANEKNNKLHQYNLVLHLSIPDLQTIPFKINKKIMKICGKYNIALEIIGE